CWRMQARWVVRASSTLAWPTFEPAAAGVPASGLWPEPQPPSAAATSVAPAMILARNMPARVEDPVGWSFRLASSMPVFAALTGPLPKAVVIVVAALAATALLARSPRARPGAYWGPLV